MLDFFFIRHVIFRCFIFIKMKPLQKSLLLLIILNSISSTFSMYVYPYWDTHRKHIVLFYCGLFSPLTHKKTIPFSSLLFCFGVLGVFFWLNMSLSHPSTSGLINLPFDSWLVYGFYSMDIICLCRHSSINKYLGSFQVLLCFVCKQHSRVVLLKVCGHTPPVRPSRCMLALHDEMRIETGGEHWGTFMAIGQSNVLSTFTIKLGNCILKVFYF